MCIYNFFSSHFAVAFHAKLISTFFFPRAFGDNKFHGSLRGQKTFIELTGGRQKERKNRNECRRAGGGQVGAEIYFGLSSGNGSQY